MTTTNTTTSGAADLPKAQHPAAERDELLQVAIDFIGTLTGMKPPPIEVAPPEVFAPFRAFVDQVQSVTSRYAALAAGQATAAKPAAPPNAITASVMRDDGGEAPAFCLMAAYRSEKDAMDAFAMLAAAPAQPAAQQPAQSSAAADTVVLEAALRAIHQAIDLIGEPDTERLRTVRRVLRGAVVVAEDCKAPQADSQPAPVVDRARTREIFIAHGFTVKEGQTDLKQYVYDAADALLRAASAPADSVLEDAALWFAERDNVLHSFWVLLGEAEVHADNDNNPLLKHQVEEFYRQWNALNGTTLNPRWVSRAARKQGGA